jgi:hypothetical protein
MNRKALARSVSHKRHKTSTRQHAQEGTPCVRLQEKGGKMLLQPAKGYRKGTACATLLLFSAFSGARS